MAKSGIIGKFSNQCAFVNNDFLYIIIYISISFLLSVSSLDSYEWAQSKPCDC